MLDLVDIFVALQFADLVKYSCQSFQPIAPASTCVALLGTREPADQAFAIFVEFLDFLPICRIQVIPRIFSFFLSIALQYSRRRMVQAPGYRIPIRGREPLLNDMRELVRQQSPPVLRLRREL